MSPTLLLMFRFLSCFVLHISKYGTKMLSMFVVKPWQYAKEGGQMLIIVRRISKNPPTNSAWHFPNGGGKGSGHIASYVATLNGCGTCLMGHQPKCQFTWPAAGWGEPCRQHAQLSRPPTSEDFAGFRLAWSAQK